MLESIGAGDLFDHNLTIAIAGDPTARILGAQVQPFNQRSVFRLVVRRVSNTFRVLMKNDTGRVANYDADGARPGIPTTPPIGIEIDLNEFIRAHPTSLLNVRSRRRLPDPRNNVRARIAIDPLFCGRYPYTC